MSKLYNVLDSMIARMKDAVSYSEVQELTDEEKQQVRENIGLGTASVQSDWSENDKTSDSYVKNRPFYETDNGEVVKLDEKYLPDSIVLDDSDAAELVMEMGLVFPVAAEDGSIYTDENGAIYSL